MFEDQRLCLDASFIGYFSQTTNTDSIRPIIGSNHVVGLPVRNNTMQYRAHVHSMCELRPWRKCVFAAWNLDTGTALSHYWLQQRSMCFGLQFVKFRWRKIMSLCSITSSNSGLWHAVRSKAARKASRYYSQLQMCSLFHTLMGITFAIQIESDNYKVEMQDIAECTNCNQIMRNSIMLERRVKIVCDLPTSWALQREINFCQCGVCANSTKQM